MVRKTWCHQIAVRRADLLDLGGGLAAVCSSSSATTSFGGNPHTLRRPSPAPCRFPRAVLQATVGPCNVPKPRAWNPVEQSKWTSWHGLGSMPSAEAMRLFVKILEEDDPGWYSRVPEFNPEPVVDIEMHKPKEEPNTVSASTNGTSIPEPKSLKPFLKMEAQWRHRTKLLFWKALVLSVLMKNGLHYLSAGSVRNLIMSMEQLCCKTKCIYLVETIMGVILVTFRRRFWI